MSVNLSSEFPYEPCMRSLKKISSKIKIISFPESSSRRAVTQDRRKTAKTICGPNVGPADVGAEAPIKGLPTDSKLVQLSARILRKPLNWGFRLNFGLADGGPANNFCRFSTILKHCATVFLT